MGAWDVDLHEIIIVGAGIAGLTAARTLQDMGFDSIVLEKSKGIGGRCATRRLGEGIFDHGSQFFTVREPAFQELVDGWMMKGAAKEWTRGFPVIGDVTELAGHPRYCGVDGMTGMARLMAEGLDIRREHRVKRVSEARACWQIEVEGGVRMRAGVLVLTAPVPQALRLINDENTWRIGAALSPLLVIHYSPCFTAMALLDGPSGLPGPGAARVEDGPISWIADNQRKGISPGAVAVTIHASRRFSEEHLEEDPQEIARVLQEAAQPLLESRITECRGHRWRYAVPSSTLPVGCFEVSGRAPLFFAGDAFAGNRVEGAALSGLAVARAVAQIMDKGGQKK
jgi:predicted NAD/FAD-dependent oxidoreductase